MLILLLLMLMLLLMLKLMGHPTSIHGPLIQPSTRRRFRNAHLYVFRSCASPCPYTSDRFLMLDPATTMHNRGVKLLKADVAGSGDALAATAILGARALGCEAGSWHRGRELLRGLDVQGSVVPCLPFVFAGGDGVVAAGSEEEVGALLLLVVLLLLLLGG